MGCLCRLIYFSLSCFLLSSFLIDIAASKLVLKIRAPPSCKQKEKIGTTNKIKQFVALEEQYETEYQETERF